MDLSAPNPPPTKPPPQPKATGGQGFKCHAWPSERPAPGSCLLGGGGTGRGGRTPREDRERRVGVGGGRTHPPPIVHYDGHELLTDSGSSVSSCHAPLAALSRSCSHTKTLTERAPPTPPNSLQLWSWYVLQSGLKGGCRLQLQLPLWAGGQTSSASHCSTRTEKENQSQLLFILYIFFFWSNHKHGTLKC